MNRLGARGYLLVAIILIAGITTLTADTPTVIGEVREYRAETPHPYPMGSIERPVVWRDTVISPGATFVRVHFSGFSLAPGDYLTVSDPAGSEVWTYSMQGPHDDGDVWAFAVAGDTAIVEIHGGPDTGHGYVIDAVGHGLEQLIPPPLFEPYCGPYVREDVRCYMSGGPKPLAGFDEAQSPVALLELVQQSRLIRCTGWLIDGEHPNTLITTNECVKNRGQLNSLQAVFNSQSDYCGTNSSRNPRTYVTYIGDNILKTSKPDRLDYTLLTLAGTAEADWGELIASAQPVNAGEEFWIIQHPHSDLKKDVGVWEDRSINLPCSVATVDATIIHTRAPGTEIEYLCYAAVGTRGAPVIDADSPHHVVAIHNGVHTVPSCMLNGTEMRHICEDAGSLLNCQ